MLANILFIYSFFMLECTLAREIFVQAEFLLHENWSSRLFNPPRNQLWMLQVRCISRDIWILHFFLLMWLVIFVQLWFNKILQEFMGQLSHCRLETIAFNRFPSLPSLASKMQFVLMFMTQNVTITLDKIPHYVLRTTFTNSFKETKKGPGLHGNRI